MSSIIEWEIPLFGPASYGVEYSSDVHAFWLHITATFMFGMVLAAVPQMLSMMYNGAAGWSLSTALIAKINSSWGHVTWARVAAVVLGALVMSAHVWILMWLQVWGIYTFWYDQARYDRFKFAFLEPLIRFVVACTVLIVVRKCLAQQPSHKASSFVESAK